MLGNSFIFCVHFCRKEKRETKPNNECELSKIIQSLNLMNFVLVARRKRTVTDDNVVMLSATAEGKSLIDFLNK